MSMLWFEHCAVYLNRLEALDTHFGLYDTLPTTNRAEKIQKRLALDWLMRTMQEKRDIEKDLDELWGCDAGCPR